MKLLLDTSVLGRICHPPKHPDVAEWFAAIAATAAAQHDVVLSEIVDYELRRELVRIGSKKSLALLDKIVAIFPHAGIDQPLLARAARLWAEARKAGRPGAANEAIDADVIIAAQALAHGAVVVTENVKHFKPFVAARRWSEIK